MLDWMLMPYRRYAEFSGRSRRKEYWSFALFFALVYLVLGALMVAGGYSVTNLYAPEPAMAETPGVLFWVGAGLLALFALGSIVPSIAVGVRRLHDRGLSGWWYLGVIIASMIPVIGFLAGIAFLVLMVLPGTPGPNKYGPDPKDPASVEVFA
jgi:uncharacterized membrane protein YhaH (DUF805 family)